MRRRAAQSARRPRSGADRLWTMTARRGIQRAPLSARRSEAPNRSAPRQARFQNCRGGPWFSLWLRRQSFSVSSHFWNSIAFRSSRNCLAQSSLTIDSVPHDTTWFEIVYPKIFRVRPENFREITIARESFWLKPDVRQPDEGKSRSFAAFVVLGQAPVAIDPGVGALHDESVLGRTSKPLAVSERLTTSSVHAASAMALRSSSPPWAPPDV